MIVFDRNKKEIKVPEGLGNINITVLDATMEDVVANITDIETTILPSPGYNGMSSVEVNAQSVYDNGYNVGNTEGYEQGNIAGYENGFVEGNATGYANGVNDGKAEQKALLEPITITENGVYSTEDGYSEVTVNIEDTNGSYDVGYSEGYDAGIEEGTANAGEIIAETARVLDITENGIYTSKYSEPIILNTPTGKFANGDNFYNYAKLDGVVFDTGIVGEPNITYELWWKPDEHFADYYTVLGYQNFPYQDFKLCEKGDLRLGIEYGRQWNLNDISFEINNDWNHFLLSKNDGVIVNGNLVAEITQTMSDEVESPTVWINAAKSDELNYNANGYFGMIKITANGVENVIIPTAEGFLNTTTNELLTKIQNGDYIFIEPEFEYSEPTGNLIKTVNVNVIPKIDISKEGIKFGNSTFSTVPEWADLSNVSDFSYLFNSCLNIQILSELPTHNATRMNHIFDNCTRLTIAPVMSTNKVTDVSYMFWQCAALQQIPTYDFSNVTNISYMFRYSFQGNMDKLTDVGGFIGLSCNWGDDYGLAICSNLTYQSCINILNGLADVTELGSRTLKVHQNFLTTVGDEISIGTNKGWTITA